MDSMSSHAHGHESGHTALRDHLVQPLSETNIRSRFSTVLPLPFPPGVRPTVGSQVVLALEIPHKNGVRQGCVVKVTHAPTTDCACNPEATYEVPQPAAASAVPACAAGRLSQIRFAPLRGAAQNLEKRSPVLKASRAKE